MFPKPISAAFAAVVFSDSIIVKTPRTRVPARSASAVKRATSSASSSGLNLKKIGKISTGARLASRTLKTSINALAHSHHYPRGCCAQDRVDHFDHHAAQDDAERAAFQLVGEPRAARLRGESVAMRQHKAAVVREWEEHHPVRDERDGKVQKRREPDSLPCRRWRRVARDRENDLLEPDVQPEREHGDERERGQREIEREQAMADARVFFGLLLAGGINGHEKSVDGQQ